MKLYKTLQNKLNGRKIRGKDDKLYELNVFGGGSTSIYVRNTQNRELYGFVPDIRDLGKKLLQCEVSDFTGICEKGLFKKTMELISEVVPRNTSYESSLYSEWDRNNIFEYVHNNFNSFNIQEALSITCFGHVLLASKFNDLKVSYKGLKTILQGKDALIQYYKDIKNRIFPGSHGTELCVTGTKL